MIRLLITLWTVSSLVGCGGVTKPDTTLYVANPLLKQFKGYNLATDFDDNGELLATAKPKYLPLITPMDVNKFICTDPAGFANLKAYVQELRAYYQNNCTSN